MTVVNPKSISGINSITMASGSDNLLTIHTTNTTERVRVNSDGDVIVGSGITVSPDGDIFATGVTTSTTFSGNFSGGTVSGTTGTFSSHVSLGDGDELRIGDSSDLKLYHTAGTANYIQASGGHANIHLSNIHQLKNQANDAFMAAFTNGGSVQLYHNGTEKFSTQSYGIAVDGVVAFTKDANDDTTSTLQINGSSMTSTDYNYLMTATNDQNANLLTMFINGSGRSTDGGANGLTIRNDNGPMSVGANSGTYSTIYYTGAAGGINFGGTSDGGNQYTSSMLNEQLSDYEFGTFTPALAGDSSAGTYTYTSAIGLYIRVGQMVHFQLDVRLSGISAAGSGNATITGLPFTSNAAYYSGGNIAYYTGWTGNSIHTALLNVNNAALYLYKNLTTTNITNVVVGDVTASSRVIISGTYAAA